MLKEIHTKNVALTRSHRRFTSNWTRIKRNLVPNVGYYALFTTFICFCVTGMSQDPEFTFNYEDEVEMNLAIQMKQRQARERDGPKLILLWTKYFGSDDFNFGLGALPFAREGCSCGTCEITTDRELLGVSDAVIFHSNGIDPDDMPRVRLPHQKWIFYSFTAPPHHVRLPMRLLNKFNWTMTYRGDSDIVTRFPFGGVEPNKNIRTSYGILKQQLMKSRGNYPVKQKLIAWIASTCATSVHRENYVHQLNQHIPIDIYGSCGDKYCGNDQECNDLIGSSYKFVLTLETELCTDYISEKTMAALELGVVPVVYAAVDLDKYLPPHSYINARDFKSPKELADYLLMLEMNPELYRKYFSWRQDYKVNRYPTKGWCDLCEKLNTDVHNQYYEDIDHWWVEEAVCESSYKIY